MDTVNSKSITSKGSKKSYDQYDLKFGVKLPIGEDRREWIANNIHDFHKQICMLYGTINKFCTKEKCPKMTVDTKGIQFEYIWSGEPGREPMSAKEYILHSLDWAQEQLDDETVFPCISGQQFPPDFMSICETITKRLLRVFAHVYHNHAADVKSLHEEPHMNTSLKHFIYFVQEFNLAPDSLDPLRDFIATIKTMESSK